MVAVKKLTPYQRQLRRDIGYVTYVSKMDPDDVPDETWRTGHLEHVRDRLVRSVVSSEYTLIDTWLTVNITHHFFRGAPRWSKKLRLFNQYVMDEMYLLQKVRLVHAIAPLPSKIREHAERINAVRNALSHNHFPEDRRQYSTHRKVMYRGVHLFGMKGVEYFVHDAAEVIGELERRVLGESLAAALAERS